MKNTYYDIATTARVINAGIPEDHTGCPTCKAHINAMPKRGPSGKDWVVLIDVEHYDQTCSTLAKHRGLLTRAQPWNLRTVWVRHRQYWAQADVRDRVAIALDDALEDTTREAGAKSTDISFAAIQRLREDLDEIAVLADEALHPYVPGEDGEDAPF